MKKLQLILSFGLVMIYAQVYGMQKEQQSQETAKIKEESLVRKSYRDKIGKCGTLSQRTILQFTEAEVTLLSQDLMRWSSKDIAAYKKGEAAKREAVFYKLVAGGALATTAVALGFIAYQNRK